MSRADAARKLIAERDASVAAQAAAHQAHRAFVEAERDYFQACKAESNDKPGSEYPTNLLIDTTLIMPVSEWYDVAEGKRLEFHTVEVLP